MSWYTNLYPNVDEFPSRDLFKSPGEMQEEADKWNDVLNEIWGKIHALAFITPSKDIASIESLIANFEQLWNAYINASKEQYDLYRAVEIWEDEINHQEYIEKYPEGGGWCDIEQYDDDGKEISKEDYIKKVQEERAKWKPSISWNHFQYNDCPEAGVIDNKKFIADIKNKLMALVVATPKDITPDKSEDGYNPISYITEELNNSKEWLDDCLYELFFSELYVKYKDTSTQG